MQMMWWNQMHWKKLYKTVIKYDADCVCANMRSYWKGIKLKTKYQRPCFNIERPKVYDQKEIIDDIYWLFWNHRLSS